MSTWLAPFDPDRDFIVRRLSFLAAGTVYRQGDDFPKEVVNERVLRNLYNTRAISYAGEAYKLKAETLPSRPAQEDVDPVDTVSGRVDALEHMTKKDLIALIQSMGLKLDRSLTKRQLASQIVSAEDGAS